MRCHEQEEAVRWPRAAPGRVPSNRVPDKEAFGQVKISSLQMQKQEKKLLHPIQVIISFVSAKQV